MASISVFRRTGYEVTPVLLGSWAELFRVQVMKAALSWRPTQYLHILPTRRRNEKPYRSNYYYYYSNVYRITLKVNNLTKKFCGV
jgi:hypothetical protein